MTTDIRIFNDIRVYLNAAIKPWRDAIYKRQNNRCRISDQYRSVDVHHVAKSFSSIVDETFAATGIEYRPHTYEYTQDELNLLSATILALHKDVKGALVARRLHELYHKRYGNSCTSNNWKEFKSQFKIRRRVA